MLRTRPADRVCDAARVPPATRAVTARLEREGANAPALSRAAIKQRRARGQAGPLRNEPPYEAAVERLIEGAGGGLRLRVLAQEAPRAAYLHVHGGGWVFGAADRQ